MHYRTLASHPDASRLLFTQTGSNQTNRTTLLVSAITRPTGVGLEVLLDTRDSADTRPQTLLAIVSSINVLTAQVGRGAAGGG